MEIVQKYTQMSFTQYFTIHLIYLNPNIEPTATGHIIDQIEMIEKIIREWVCVCNPMDLFILTIIKSLIKNINMAELSNRNLDEI